MAATKVCARCNSEKPHADFNKSKQNHDGLDSYCRDCRREYMRSRCLLLKDPNNAEARAYFEKHKRDDLSLRDKKTCGRCGEEKPVSEFNRMSSRPDGRQGYCRQCNALHHRGYYAANLATERAKGRAYYLANKEARQRYSRRYNIMNRKNHATHHVVRAAVKSGQLPHIDTQSCAHCGQAAAEYHHPDYSRPLDVVPLCHSCHKRVHVSVLRDDAAFEYTITV